ncbi:MAG TPA: hypothetical protein DCP53_07275 [Elusimicrobia bacterium]|nr:MAG: hypothetical protein A2551_02040 [Elusimicrobia bacterium RIFOXYD2_FULL_34_30]HAM39175.1 hypothetical protein [Elusimicrobiota bacterium]
MKKLFFTCLLFLSASLLICQSIKINKKEINFGQVSQGKTLNYVLELHNLSTKVLKVGLRPSCDCINAFPERFDISPKNRKTIKITIDTKDYLKDFSKDLFIQSNDPKNPYISIKIKGYIFADKQPVIPITIFDSAGCLFCKELKKNIIPFYEKKYGIRMDVAEYSIDESRNYAALVTLEKQFGKTLTKVPVLFIGNDVVGGKKDILESLPKLLEKYIKTGNVKRVEMPFNDMNKKIMIKNLKILPVISAGLIDSVNPCAFATIIFFITYLNMILKKQRKEILFVGISFITGVFITYFLIGIGLFKFIQRINQIVIISKIMYFFIGILTLFFAFRHLYEAILIKKGTGIGDNTLKLKLPNVIRWKIYDLITKYTAFKYLIFIAFFIGAVITVLELFCTGQIYLPTIIYMVGLPEYRTSGTLYLLLYCLLFIIPLIIIFSIFYFGASMENIENVFRSKIYYIKIIMFVFFLTLGILIFNLLFFT